MTQVFKMLLTLFSLLCAKIAVNAFILARSYLQSERYKNEKECQLPSRFPN